MYSGDSSVYQNAIEEGGNKQPLNRNVFHESEWSYQSGRGTCIMLNAYINTLTCVQTNPEK